ncbi:nuclear protein MDM1 [Caerostris extrusa]|uniref:Nuclear protein MDM1 n=1 Tax=Caerostris extrusa TaxID=172846 RepID=A0AAV4WSJ1_CAEEX|nr:nuclear protein MDM1 [Caerostris extrusa]
MRQGTLWNNRRSRVTARQEGLEKYLHTSAERQLKEIVKEINVLEPMSCHNVSGALALRKVPGQPARDHLLYDKDEGESSDSLEVGPHLGLVSQESDSRARIPDEDSRPQSKNPDDGDSRKTEEKQPLMSQSFPPSTNPRGNPGTRASLKKGRCPRPPSTAPSSSPGPGTPERAPPPGSPPPWDSSPTRTSLMVRLHPTEYKAKFRPFSAYTYVDGSWKKATRLIKDNESASEEDQHAWYSEVVERLKKADQYRARSYTGAPLNGSEPLPLEFFVRDRTVLSPVSVASSSRENLDHSKSREGSTKKKSQVEKTTVRPKSAEPVIPVKSEHKSPKRTRPRAPKDLPVHGHGDLSGRKKAYKQSAEKSSPVGMKPRAVQKPSETKGAKGEDEREHTAVSMIKAPAKVPLTTVKSPEEVTGVRSPDPESWTVPLEIGKGLHWMDGKTPDGVQAKGPPILLSKRLKESSLIGKNQKDMVICDPGSETTGESVDL